jgi:hypothetical protein
MVQQDLKYARWDGSSWQIETVDGAASKVGQYSSLALDADGFPHISYADRTNNALKHAHWNGSAWNIEIVDGAVGDYTEPRMVLDSAQHPHISYEDRTTDTVKYARWDGSTWHLSTVDAGWKPSIALDALELPHIAYQHLASVDLRYAHWDGTAWRIETIDSDGNMGLHSSLAFDSGFRPHIAYFDRTNWDLEYARRNSPYPLRVPIDIKPGSYPNCFNNDGNGVIPVAILGRLQQRWQWCDPRRHSRQRGLRRPRRRRCVALS